MEGQPDTLTLRVAIHKVGEGELESVKGPKVGVYGSEGEGERMVGVNEGVEESEIVGEMEGEEEGVDTKVPLTTRLLLAPTLKEMSVVGVF